MKNNFALLLGVTICILVASIIIIGVGIHKRVTRETKTCVADEQILTDFLTRVQNAYYENNPNKIVYKPSSTLKDTRDKFRPYDCTPAAIKARTDAAKHLYDEVKKLKISEKSLNTRERRAFAQVKHYLQNNFGTPFDENYYAGDWMLGPNLFCWQPICSIGTEFASHFNSKSYGFQPKSVADLEYLLDVIRKYGKSINQYVKNMKMGVLAGMVRSEEQCKAGIDAIKGRFPKVSERGAKGILDEKIVAAVRSPSYFNKLPESEVKIWGKKTGKMANVSIDEHLLEHMGKPLDEFIKYLVNDHYTHCTPSAEHSGLASLPLDYVWVGGKEDKSRPTNKKLPTGEILSGKKAYEAILPYFTTIDMSPDEIYNMGEKQLNVLYPKAVEIAKKLTNLTDNVQAAAQFKSTILDSPSSYFNATLIPSNETGEIAHKKCKDMTSASKFCPVRYNAMVSWFDYVQTVLAKLDPMTVKFFHFTGNKSTTPNCPLQMVAKFNPSSGSQSYSGAGKSCLRACYYYLPFWLTPPGPKWNAISVGAHEGRPGHHTQVQGFNEHFSSSGGGPNDVIDWLNRETYYTAFTEGWALYAENPILAQETDIYHKDKLQEYGMLKWQIWRALRLMIDTGLHYKGSRKSVPVIFCKKKRERGSSTSSGSTRLCSSENIQKKIIETAPEKTKEYVGPCSTVLKERFENNACPWDKVLSGSSITIIWTCKGAALEKKAIWNIMKYTTANCGLEENSNVCVAAIVPVKRNNLLNRSSKLVSKGMKRQKALELFEKYAWDTGDKSKKDVTRYQSSPGQATGYMIGQLAIWRIRNDTMAKFKANNIKFSEKEFHFYLLSQGSAPLSYLESFMKDYVSCKINSKQDFCSSVLDPLGTRKASSKSRNIVGDRPIEPKPFHEHYD